MLIYLIRNKINNKIYVGKTSKTLEERWKLHVRNSFGPYFRKQLITKAIKKYSKDSFELSVLENCEDNNTLCEREKFWISELKSRDLNIGYNLTDGGEGTPGRFVSERTKKLLRGRKRSLETRKKLSEIAKTRVFSKETREKISKSRLGSKNPFFGKSWGRKGKLSEVTKNRISEAHKGKILSEEHRERIKLSLKNVDKTILGSNKGKLWPIFGYINNVIIKIYDGFDDVSKKHGMNIREVRYLSKQGVPVNGMILVKQKRYSKEDLENAKKELEKQV
jgi:group I intron endonuclease